MLLLSCLQTAAAVAAQATRVAAVAAQVTDSWLSGLLRTIAHAAPHESLLVAAPSAAAAARGTTVVVEESRLLSSSNVTLRTDQ